MNNKGIIGKIVETHFKGTKIKVLAKLVGIAFYTLTVIVFIVMMFS